jgi:dTDP-4-dehydrorhamnose 3,5-epimerase
MKLVPTKIAGVFEATTSRQEDARGSFGRLFCADDLQSAQNGRPIVQINRSVTRKAGAIRGLHFQHPPKAEAKWVRCLRGRVWDVAVDLRRGSPTFLHWHAAELDGKAMNALFIPEGCAHGFQTLAEDCEMLYLHSAPYAPGFEGAARFDDPRLAIAWPRPVTELSERDRSHPLLANGFEGIEL